LADHAAGSPYELAGLMTLANSLDAEIREADSDEVAELNPQAYAVYRRLTGLFNETSSQRVAGSRNARVALSRLAHYAVQLGKHAEAANLLEQLLDMAPKDRNYLRRASQAHAAAGQHEQALVHCRTLLRGLRKGSDEWFEAKMLQLKSLAQTDVEQARKVLRQFKLLYPDMGGDKWRDQFNELTSRW
jgi:tetratricopeptide (TPR) repeat protein